jgi:transposase
VIVIDAKSDPIEPPEGLLTLLSARKNMDCIAAFESVGTYRGAAAICGVDPKTVRRKVEAHQAGVLAEERAVRAPVAKNTDVARQVVTDKIEATKGRISAKRLLPIGRAAGYTGSPRNFRRLVAELKRAFRAEQGRHQRRPAIWVPGETLVIDWGTVPGTRWHVFCAVLAWSRFRFVRFSTDETAPTTFALLAECFEELGGAPAKVLADRMGCLKAGTVANVVIPTVDYVRFATHYRFTPDFCHANDPASKGIVENLVGYAKTDVIIPDGDDVAIVNVAAAVWCVEVNGREHSEICAIPAERLVVERDVLRSLPMLRPRIGRVEVRKVDKLSTIRAASVRYSVPHRLVGSHVEVVTHDGHVRIYGPGGDVVAEHVQLAAGEASVLDEHYPTPRKPVSRGPRARTDLEREFLALGEAAEVFIRHGAAAGVATLSKEIIEIVTELIPAHGADAVSRAVARATRFGRFRAGDIRSILAIGPAAPEPAEPGTAVIVGLPVVEVRSFDAYRIENLA